MIFIPACRMDGAEHRTDAARLHQLEVDTVHASGKRRHVLRVVNALVGEHRDADALAHPAQAGPVVPRNRLFHQLDAQRLDLTQHAHRVRGTPRGVGIDPQESAVAAADEAQVLDVLGSPELHLDDREVADRVELLLHLLGIGHPERDRRTRHRSRIETEELPHLHPSRRPIQSCSADSSAARAARWPSSSWSSRCSIASSANGSSPRCGAQASSARSTSTRFSP